MNSTLNPAGDLFPASSAVAMTSHVDSKLVNANLDETGVPIRDQPISIGTVFGFPDAVDALTHAFPDVKNPLVPRALENYVFDRMNFSVVHGFLTHPADDGLFLLGPFGSGKTSLPVQIAARLNWPVTSYTAHGQLEHSDLVGHHSLNADSAMEFVYGPLPTAMREGHILILNEIDMADPSALAGLHDVIEGRPLCIESNGGEVVHPHPNFRLICTGNTVSGDASGLYAGTTRLNEAFKDRFSFWEIDYMPEEVELDILTRHAPDIPEDIVRNMIRLANKVRDLFRGADGVDATLTITFSTRTLCRWATRTQQFSRTKAPLKFALAMSLLARAEPEQKLSIEQLARDIFGHHVWEGEV